MLAKPVRRSEEFIVDFAVRMAEYFEAVKIQALVDIRQIDRAKRSGMITKPIVSRETERARISVHEKAQNNPLLRELLRKVELRLPG